MKHFILLVGYILFLSMISISHANENTNTKPPKKALLNNLSISSSELNQLIAFDNIDKTIHSNFTFEPLPQIQGIYTLGRVSLETGLMQSYNSSDWSKYYLAGAIVLHKHNAFNLSLTAGVEQLKSTTLNYPQAPYLDNLSKTNNSEYNYSYGLVGHYSLDSTWHFTGGIIHTPSKNSLPNDNIYINNHMALVGTTYSF